MSIAVQAEVLAVRHTCDSSSPTSRYVTNWQACLFHVAFKCESRCRHCMAV